MTPMQHMATLLNTTASFLGAYRAICCAVLAIWYALGAVVIGS